jgi:hypothetical protein
MLFEEKKNAALQNADPGLVIRADPRVNCREVNTRSQLLLLGISLVNGKRSVVKRLS